MAKLFVWWAAGRTKSVTKLSILLDISGGTVRLGQHVGLDPILFQPGRLDVSYHHNRTYRILCNTAILGTAVAAVVFIGNGAICLCRFASAHSSLWSRVMTRREVGIALMINVALMMIFFVCAVVNDGRLKDEIIRLETENFKLNAGMKVLLHATEKQGPRTKEFQVRGEMPRPEPI